MGWQKTLLAVRAVWLVVAAQAIVAVVAADVGRTNEGLQHLPGKSWLALCYHERQHTARKPERGDEEEQHALC